MKHYLVIQLARFGDLIQTKRLLATLCARDNAGVHLCVDRSLAPLARIIYPDVFIHAIAAHGTGLGGHEVITAMLEDNRHVFSELKSYDFQAVYNLNFSSLNYRLAALFDPACVHGYAWFNGQELTSKWASMAMRWSGHRRIGINLVDFWAGYCPDMIAPERVNPAASPKGGGTGVVLAGRESRRSLPVDVLAQIVTTTVRASKSQKVFLLGGPGEQAAGQAVLKQLPTAIHVKTENLAGKTDWLALVDIVGSLDNLLTPDTGTMHLAAHLGTPVTAFFLSSAWCFETGPYGKGHTVYQALTDCLPCLETQACPYNVKCLDCFSSPAFHRFAVTGKDTHIPQNMIAFESGFDGLGQIYIPTAGDDPDGPMRTKFRNFVHQYIHGAGQAVSDMDAVFAQRFFKEKDWINSEPSVTTGI